MKGFAVAPRRFEHKGEQFELCVYSSDDEFALLENELNAFERENQSSENDFQLAEHQDIAFWTELSSFSARLRLFKKRYLFVGWLLTGTTKKLVYTMGNQMGQAFFPQIGLASSLFGMLERVHVNHRRSGLSGVFLLHYITMLEEISDEFPFGWGYIDRLNPKSLSRAVPLGSKETSSFVYIYGGHTMLLRRQEQKSAAVSGRLQPNSFDFLSYFDGTQLAPGPSIWEEWRSSKKLIGGVELWNESRSMCVCATLFKADWVKVVDSSRTALASSLVIISNLSPFRSTAKGALEPVYGHEVAAFAPLVQELVALSHAQSGETFALVDIDEQTQGPFIERLCSDPQILARASEVYDCE